MRFRIAVFRFLCSIIIQFSPVISNNTIPFCYFVFLIGSVFQMMPTSEYFVIAVAFVKCLYSGCKTVPNGHTTLKNVDSMSLQFQNVALTLIRRFYKCHEHSGCPALHYNDDSIAFSVICSLRKHAYSNKLKISPPKTERFQIKILRTSTTVYVFWAEIRKIMYAL